MGRLIINIFLSKQSTGRAQYIGRNNSLGKWSTLERHVLVGVKRLLQHGRMLDPIKLRQKGITRSGYLLSIQYKRIETKAVIYAANTHGLIQIVN